MDKRIEEFTFDPPEGLESRLYSPTYPVSEDAIRGQIQGVSNQLRDKLNELLINLGKDSEDECGADYVGASPLPGISSLRVGGQLREIFALLQTLVTGSIPDGTVTTAKLADGAVTREKISGGTIPFDWVEGAMRVETGEYWGSGVAGEHNANTLTFDGAPQLVIVSSSEYDGGSRGYLILIRGALCALGFGNLAMSRGSVWIEWGENSVSWYSDGNTSTDIIIQGNQDSFIYNYVAFVN